jgi:hypothetical protein
MIDELYIYQEYVRQRNNFTGQLRRIPKRLSKTLSDKQIELLSTLSLYFNTKWRDIDLSLYFNAGFVVYQKKFYINKFLSPRIIRQYIAMDKSVKMISDSLLQDMRKSLAFVIEVTKEYQIDPLYAYSLMHLGNIPIVVEHYRQGKISSVFVAYFIAQGYLTVDDYIRPYLEPMIGSYHDYISNIRKLNINVKGILNEVKMQKTKGKLLKDKKEEEPLLFGTEAETEEEKRKKEGEYQEKNLNEGG